MHTPSDTEVLVVAAVETEVLVSAETDVVVGNQMVAVTVDGTLPPAVIKHILTKGL